MYIYNENSPLNVQIQSMQTHNASAGEKKNT